MSTLIICRTCLAVGVTVFIQGNSMTCGNCNAEIVDAVAIKGRKPHTRREGIMTKVNGKHKCIVEAIEEIERNDHEPSGWCPRCEIEIFHGAKKCEICGGEVEE